MAGMLLLQAIERVRKGMDGVKMRAPDGAVFFSAVTDLGCTGASHGMMGDHYIAVPKHVLLLSSAYLP